MQSTQAMMHAMLLLVLAQASFAAAQNNSAQNNGAQLQTHDGHIFAVSGAGVRSNLTDMMSKVQASPLLP